MNLRLLCRSLLLLVCALLAHAAFFVKFKNSEVTYYYYSQNASNYIQVQAKDVATVIKEDTKISFLVHGWTESRNKTWYKLLTKALQSRNYGVIQVDYSKPANHSYVGSVILVPKVAKAICEVVVALTKTVSLENINMIGHSLGGQIIGYVGRCFEKETGKKLPILKALDPARPVFDLILFARRRLSAKDAEMVFAMHTDMGGAGFTSIKGAINVYPNGGKRLQPGCPRPDDSGSLCSHHMSYWFYICAVKNYPGGLLAEKCDSYKDFEKNECKGSKILDLGSDNFPSDDKGDYYLRTKSKPCFRIDP